MATRGAQEGKVGNISYLEAVNRFVLFSVSFDPFPLNFVLHVDVMQLKEVWCVGI